MNSPIGGTVPSNNTGHLYPKQVMPQAPVFKNSRNLVTSNHHTSLKAANQSDRIKAQIKSGYSHPYNYDGTSGSPSASRIERGFVGHSQGVSPLGLIGETPKKIENRWIPYEESPEPTRKVAAGKSNIPSDLSKIIEKEISKAQQISSRAIEPSRRVNDYMNSFMNKNLQSHRNSLQEQPSHPRVPMSMQNSQVQKQPVQPKQALRQQQPSMDLGRARQLAQGPQSSVRMGRAGEQRLGSTQLRPHQAEIPEREMTHDLLKPDRHPELFPNHQQVLPQGGISADKPVHDAYNPDYQPKSMVEIMKQSNINPSLQASPRSKFVDYRKQVKKTINRLPPLAQDRREHTERVGSISKRNESYQNTERSARDLIDLQTPDYPAAGLPLNSRYNFPKHYLLKGEDPNRTSVSNAWDNPGTNRTHQEAVPIPQVEAQPPHSSAEGMSFMSHNQPSFQLGNSFDNALNIIEPNEPSFSPGNSNRTFRQNSPEASAFVFPSAPNPTQTAKRDQNNAGLQPQLPVVNPIPGSRVIGRNHRRFETQPDIPQVINPVFSSIETSGDEPKSLERSTLKYPGLASIAKGQPDRLSPPLATPLEQPYQSSRDQPYGANPSSSSRALAMTSVKKPNYQPTFHQEPFILVENMEEEQVVKPNNVQAAATQSQRQTNRSMMQKQAPLEPTSKFESHRPSLPETKPILKNNLNDHRFRGGYLQKRYNPGKRQVSIFDKGSDYESTIKSQKLTKGGTMVQKKSKPQAVSPYDDPTQKPFYNSLPTALGDSGGGGVTGGSGSTGGERAVVGGLVNGRAQKKLNYFSKIAEYELNRAKSKCQNSSMAAMSNSYVVDHLRNQYDSLQGSMHLDLQARLQSSQVRDSAGQDGLQKQDLVKMQNQKSMEESLERIEVLE